LVVLHAGVSLTSPKSITLFIPKDMFRAPFNVY
jgi:hypothetical protein